MYAISNDVMVVAKETHTFQNGDTVYRLSCTTGQGGLLNVECDAETFGSVVALAERYDMEIDFFTVGYNQRNKLVRLSVR